MKITVQEVIAAVEDIQAVGDAILDEITALDPALAAPDSLAQLLLDMASKAVQAWANSSATPVTVEALEALRQGTSLTPPTE